ncbi:MAG: DUF1343 domain-containing protein [Bacteroidia bacterium]
MNLRLLSFYLNRPVWQLKSRLLIGCLSLSFFVTSSCLAQDSLKRKRPEIQRTDKPVMLTGADQLSAYLPQLKQKKVAVVANPTSRIGNSHLVDTLIASGVKVVTVFAPEHGFRGEAEAGEDVAGGVDKKTGVKVVSLYGDHKEPSREDLSNVDVVLFDIQDVGVRFYTYISTLQYVMESCASYGVRLIVLDRPNPHANYVDGPVLQKEFTSFVGMQQIPVVYGMTIGEYAGMLNGEHWLKDSLKCDLLVIRLKNWKHTDDYLLPVPPSPNLPNIAAVRLYPSLCFFEGTEVSLGRGTDYPFQCYGFPDNASGSFEFTPQSIPGKAKTPPLMGKICKGELLSREGETKRPAEIELKWLLKAYADFPDKSKFFNSFFNKLSGNSELREQISRGMSEEQIRTSWKSDLEAFRNVRAKYLLYP